MIDLSTHVVDKHIDRMNKSKNYFIIGMISIILILIGAYYAIDYVDADEVSFKQVSLTETVETDYETRAYTVGEFLEENNVEVGENDLVIPSEDTEIKNGMNIEVKKAFRISITIKGETTSYYGWPGTIKETLDANELDVDEDDIVSPSLEEQAEPGIDIAIRRVTVKEETETEAVKFKTNIDYDNTIEAGKTKTVTKGQNGEKEVTYTVTYEDDEEVNREVLEENIITEATNEELIIGSKGASVVPAVATEEATTSKSEGTIAGYSYITVYEGVKAYSYYMGEAAYGASGNICTRGTCAVDTSLIPMGTKLYIEGYGFAVANDTGGDIKGKAVDVYMSSTAECYTWGIKYVKVYVLE